MATVHDAGASTTRSALSANPQVSGPLSARRLLDRGLTPAQYAGRVVACLVELGRLTGTPDERACLAAAQHIVRGQVDVARKAGDARLAGWLAAAVRALGYDRLLLDLGVQKAS